jgi:hypothetical protein
MVIRIPWDEPFVLTTHASSSAFKEHPAYADARAGDTAAAKILTRDLFKPSLAKYLSYDHVAPIQRFDSNYHWNAIPLEFAKACAIANGAKLCPLVIQDNVIPSTDSNSIAHLLLQPSFEGEVPKGRYLIVNDFSTNSSAIANMRGYIAFKGSSTVCAQSLAASFNALRISPDPEISRSIDRRFHNELSVFPERLGFTFDCLTNKESQSVNGLVNLESIRNPLAPTHYSIRLSQ